MKNIIVEVKFNNEPPTKYGYKHFDVVMKTGKVHTFHYHINNPIPTREQMLGLTWHEVIQLAKKMFYDVVKDFIKN